jgi:hypothetical protein
MDNFVTKWYTISMSERKDISFHAFSRGDDDMSSSLFALDSKKSELEQHLSTGATPLAGAEYPDVMQMQTGVREALIQRIEDNAFEDIPEELQRFMIDCFSTRFAARASKNYESYAQRLATTSPLEMSELFHTQHERAMRGTATPEELIVVRRTLGMKAIELARLTHPYGAKIELLDPMRTAVRTAIEQQGGVVFSPDDYHEKFKLRSADLLMSPDDHDEMMGLLVTRRRNIGLFDDDTLVMERSSFVIPTYAGSSFDPELSRRMRAVKLVDNPLVVQQLQEAGRIAEIAPRLLESNDFRAAMPQSTTIFAYNETTNQQIEARDEQRTLWRSPETRPSYFRQLTLGEPNYRPGDIAEMTERLDAESQSS